ncbi:MAG: hypothetical protein AAF982_02015 [Pseudomonadota bacterium]
MSQSRRASAIEALVNILVGIAVAFAANLIVLPLVGVTISVGQAGAATILFTFVSFARSYALRRLFNHWSSR